MNVNYNGAGRVGKGNFFPTRGDQAVFNGVAENYVLKMTLSKLIAEYALLTEVICSKEGEKHIAQAAVILCFQGGRRETFLGKGVGAERRAAVRIAILSALVRAFGAKPKDALRPRGHPRR